MKLLECNANLAISTGLNINFSGGYLNHDFTYFSTNFLVHWYLKMNNLVVNSGCPEAKWDWIWTFLCQVLIIAGNDALINMKKWVATVLSTYPCISRCFLVNICLISVNVYPNSDIFIHKYTTEMISAYFSQFARVIELLNIGYIKVIWLHL